MFVEKRNLQYSLALHLGVLLVAAFGLPSILPDRADPMPLVMTVEILPISAMTNVRPSPKPISKPKATPKPQPIKKEEPKPQPKPEPKPKPMEKVFDPMAEPEEKKEEKPVEKTEDEFQKLLNDLKKTAEETPEKAKDDTSTQENTTQSDAPYDESQPLSLSEKDAIRNQFIPCWSPPMGAKDAKDLVVRIQAQYQQDGALIDSQIAKDQQGRYRGDPFFRAAADAALRATRHPTCNPLKNLNPDKYGSWRDMELTFDPQLYY